MLDFNYQYIHSKKIGILYDSSRCKITKVKLNTDHHKQKKRYFEEYLCEHADGKKLGIHLIHTPMRTATQVKEHRKSKFEREAIYIDKLHDKGCHAIIVTGNLSEPAYVEKENLEVLDETPPSIDNFEVNKSQLKKMG